MLSGEAQVDIPELQRLVTSVQLPGRFGANDVFAMDERGYILPRPIVAAALLRRIAEPGAPPEQEILAPSLIVRGSCGLVPKGEGRQ